MPAAFDITFPPGRWAVGVSGGADSVALARLIGAQRPPGAVVLAHLDHQLRGAESDADAASVIALGRQLNMPVDAARREDVERPTRPRRQSASPTTGGGAEARGVRNPSARYRAARLAFFADVVRRHALDGVLLAHHADDQAETILLRLLRGRALTGLGGIAPATRIDGLAIVRPLLGVRRETLRQYLRRIGQPWREDASNASPDYRRNVVRRLLQLHPSWTAALLRLANASSALRQRVEAAAPTLVERFAAAELAIAPLPAEWAARQWLLARGAPTDRVSPAVCRRLIAQATAAASPPRQHYPGSLLVRRRQQRIDALPAAPAGGRVQSASTHGQETDTAAEL